ncbi:MAG: YhjD/YihY/BrkB family envelope integrity protein [Desulfotignum sp.]|nr:YihY family inner membrane protein [Desulfobacteraceae bacterium]
MDVTTNIAKLLGKKWHNGVRILQIASKEFVRDRCGLQASALTLYTLLSIVPVMAMAFGFAKGFGFQQFLETKVLSMFAGQEQVIQTVLTFSNNLLERTKGGLMAVLGIIFLAYSLIKLMGHMETAFNRIWRVSANRSIIRKITDFITIALAAGLLVIFSGSAIFFITAYFEKFMGMLDLPPTLEHLISFGFNIFPFVTAWLLFAFFYLFVPNKNVDVRSALAGGIIAGTIFQLVQMAYVNFLVGVSTYNAIYGSFAALPLFLLWLQASWVILLLGAEIAFVWENVDLLQTDDPAYEDIGTRMKKLIMLRTVVFCVKRFARKKAPVTPAQIAAHLNLSVNMMETFLEKLVHAGILFQVNAPKPGYTPALDIECLSVMDVVAAFENMGKEVTSMDGTLETAALEQSLERFEKAARQSSGERYIKDI